MKTSLTLSEDLLGFHGMQGGSSDFSVDRSKGSLLDAFVVSRDNLHEI